MLLWATACLRYCFRFGDTWQKAGAILHRISVTHRQMIEREHLPVVANALAPAPEPAHTQALKPKPICADL